MAEPTLTEVFGAGATQDANTITISKADLTGLTATANNRAEALFVAILLKAQAFLNTTNQGADPDRSVTVEDSFPQIVTRGENQFRQKSLTVNLQKLDDSAAIDPDDY